MNLHLTEEQKMLLETARKLFREESNTSRVRQSEVTGFDPKLWGRLVELGLHSMLVDEEKGGSGFNMLDGVIVAEESGRRIAPIPLAETLVTGLLLSMFSSNNALKAQKQFLEGEIFTIALPPRLNGQDLPIPFGTVAQHVIHLEDDKVLLKTQRPQPDSATKNLGAMPLSKENRSKELREPGSGLLIAQGPEAKKAFLVAIEKWKLLTASILVGVGKEALEMASSYSKERFQFGRPIGSYQGIAHPLADALTAVDGAKLLVWRAVWSMGLQSAETAANISMAYWWSAESISNATTKALRTFGGYGVSLEYDIQLYYRRGMAWPLVYGPPHEELLVLANRLWNNEKIEFPPEIGIEIEFGYGNSALQFANQAREFFKKNLTAELKAHAHHSVAGFDKKFNQQLAKAGFLFPHWPEKFGGHGRTVYDMAALAEVYEEFGWERITAPITNQVGQVIMSFGCEDLQNEVLNLFAKGEALACLGFTEPESGSDVFACKTRASRDGSDWIINGQKIFTTAANLADYVFLLARTDSKGPKHAGLTMFLVPLTTSGVEIQGVETIQDERTNITFYSDVRIPDRYRLGEVNEGINVMAATLELEHGGNQYRISYQKMVDKTVNWAASQTKNNRPMVEDPYLRICLTKIIVHSRVAEVLCHRAIWAGEQQLSGRTAFGPMSKLFSTEFYLADASKLMRLCAPYSLFSNDKEDLGHIELGFRQSVGMTIYGGSSEIHRSIIAEQALGMPRSRS